MDENRTLVQAERNAQDALIKIGREARAIRDERLYPGAEKHGPAWTAYCHEQFNMTRPDVERAIRMAEGRAMALPRGA